MKTKTQQAIILEDFAATWKKHTGRDYPEYEAKFQAIGKWIDKQTNGRTQ